MREKRVNVIDFLKTGKENAISQKELAELCGMHKSEMKRIIREYRKERKFIISDTNGYYLPGSDDELLAYYKKQYRKAISYFSGIKALREYLKGKGYTPEEMGEYRRVRKTEE